MKKGLGLGTLSLLLTLGAICPTGLAAKTVLNFWQPWGGTLGKGMQEIADAYMKDNPDIQIKLMAVDNNLATSEKFITSMAAGRPPELILVDGPQVIQWASKNLLTPLDTFYKSSGLKSSEFWTPSYKQTQWKGTAYALPWISDANFPLIYNKQIFNEVGLGTPPTTLEQMEMYNAKLMKTDASGKIQRVGFIPWQTYGYSNSLFSFGWAFGGDFYDETKEKVTVSHPKIVNALDWMGDFARKYDYKKLVAFQNGWEWGGKKDPLIIGKAAMLPRVADFLKAVDVAPKGYEYGWSFLPGKAGVEDKVAWLGGWTVAIPANAKNRDKAWKFIKWMCSDPKGTLQTQRSTGFTPSSRNSPAFKESNSRLAPWMETLKIAQYQRPVMPVTPVYFGELDRVVPLVLEGKKSATQALTEANTNIQKELDRYMARVNTRKK